MKVGKLKPSEGLGGERSPAASRARAARDARGSLGLRIPSGEVGSVQGCGSRASLAMFLRSGKAVDY